MYVTITSGTSTKIVLLLAGLFAPFGLGGFPDLSLGTIPPPDKK